MLASLSHRPAYQQITEIPRFDFLKHDVSRSFGRNEQTHYRLQTRFRQPGSTNDKPPSGRPHIMTPLEVRVIVTSIDVIASWPLGNFLNTLDIQQIR